MVEPWWTHKQLKSCTLHKWRDVILLDKTQKRIGEYRYCINCGEQAKVVLFNSAWMPESYTVQFWEMG